MSGKGNNTNKNKSSGNQNSGSGHGNSGSTNQDPEPTLVSGWEYHTYARGSGGDRYVYIGKDEDTGEPEFLDYGPKGGRS